MQIPTNGKQLMQSYYTMNEAEAAAMFASIAQQRQLTSNDMELLSWVLYQTGKNVSAAQYNNSLTIWDIWDEAEVKMNEFHHHYPLLLTPTNAFTAPQITTSLVADKYLEQMKNTQELSFSDQQTLIYDQWLDSLTLTPFTQQANVTGEPAILLPTTLSSQNHMPLGIQFQAAQGREDLLLQIAKLFEDEKMFKML